MSTLKIERLDKIHEAAKEQDKITVSGGRLGLQITLAPDDLCRAAKAEYADIIK